MIPHLATRISRLRSDRRGGRWPTPSILRVVQTLDAPLGAPLAGQRPRAPELLELAKVARPRDLVEFPAAPGLSLALFRLSCV